MAGPGRRVSLDDVVSLDYAAVARELRRYFAETVERAGARGVVVGVSGGVDSATTLYLAASSIGPERVLALIMPDAEVTPREDVEDALSMVRGLGVEHRLVDIHGIVESFLERLGQGDKRAVGNLRARIRMSILYFYANKMGYLVAGTGDRSEIMIGYYTKYGDGGVDFLPIGCLYKSQVRRLAVELGVPEKVAWKPSSPRLWPGQLAEEELGMSYDEIDLALYALYDLGLSVEEASRATGLPAEKIRRVEEMHKASEHKRRPPPAPSPEEYVWRFRKA